ncbi:MAG TPA: hypothetical protein VGT04_09615 [Acidobacteriaceae bacterium]|nr:hypothetical protein [Acidobacteriaceae bacterium]
MFKSKRSLTISLEAVVFEDGTAIGPDPDNKILRWRALENAERDVFAAAVESPGAFPENAAGWIHEAEAEADLYFKNKLPVEDAMLLAATRHAMEYQDIYRLFKGYKAWRVLRSLDSLGGR